MRADRPFAEAIGSLRPAIEDVATWINESFAKMNGMSFERVLVGPEAWSWVDLVGKTFMVSGSPNHDGHPMRTIRQPLAPEMDAWRTTCALILGPDKGGVLSSLTMAVVNHTGAYAGYESTVRAVVEGGDALSGLDRAIKIAGRDPEVVISVGKAVRAGGSGESN